MKNHNLSFVQEWRHIYLTPIEHQVDPANCGKGSYVTWALYYGKEAGKPLDCTTYQSLKDGSNTDYFFLDEAIDKMRDPTYCPMDVMAMHFGSQRDLVILN